MSDQWIYYPCQMGDHRAFIFYDHGIRESIDAEMPRHLLKIEVALKQPREDGLPTDGEFSQLSAFERGMETLVDQMKSHYVGRITVNGHRHFYAYTPEFEDPWSVGLHELGERHGYSLSFFVEEDESHQRYWKELYPTDDDWQVIKDLRVIETLEKEGDDGTAVRRIDHWAYFPSGSAAERFAQWARLNVYEVKGQVAEDGGSYCVRFSHEGTTRLSDISSHTIELRRKVSEGGGDYDGWETPICNASKETVA